jgi:MFS superfamily sulfate permease-like transporter
MVDESILANKGSHMHSLEERAKFKPIRFLQCIIFIAGGALLWYLLDLFYSSIEVPWYLSILFYLLYVGLSIGISVGTLIGGIFIFASAFPDSKAKEELEQIRYMSDEEYVSHFKWNTVKKVGKIAKLGWNLFGS